MSQGLQVALGALAMIALVCGVIALGVGILENFSNGAWVKGLVCALGFCLIVGIPIYVIVNAISADNAKPFDGYVYKKTYTEGHYQMMMVGKVMMNEYIPPRWNFILNSPSNDDQRSCDVNESTSDSVELGQEFHCGGYK